MRRLLIDLWTYFRDLARTCARSWNAFFFDPADPTPLGLIRVGTGLLLLWNMLVYGLDLQDYFGSDGWASLEAIEFFKVHGAPASWSFWTVVPDSWLRPVWGACIVVFFLFAAGYRSRTTAVLAWIITVSTTRRTPVSLYGFDQVIATITLYLAVCGASGRAVSIDRFLERWKRSRTALARRPKSLEALEAAIEDGRPAPSISANIGLRLIQLHICLIYGMAGLAKLQGGTWWTGMAIWGTAAAGEFRLVDMTWLAAYPWLMNAMTHGSMFLEIGFPVLIWVRPLRPLMIGLAVSLHIGVGLTLGLTEFSLAMIAGNVAFVSGPWLRSLATGRDPSKYASQVLFDGACPRCRASMALMTAGDPARLIRPIDLTSVDVSTIHPSLTKDACMTSMHVVRGDGRVFVGYDAVTALARSTPLFWLFGMLGSIPGVTQIGRKAYDRLAATRPRDIPCNDDVCGIHPPTKTSKPSREATPAGRSNSPEGRHQRSNEDLS